MTSDYLTGEHWVEDEQPSSEAFFIITPARADAPQPQHAVPMDDVIHITARRVGDEVMAVIRRRRPDADVVTFQMRQPDEDGDSGI